MSAVTLAGVLARLSPTQRDGLRRIQPQRTREAIDALVKPAARASSAPVRPSEINALVASLPDGLRVHLKGLRLISEANAHELPYVRARRAKAERAAWLAAVEGIAPPQGVTRVRVVREGVRLLDTDNLAGAAKHLRDAIAEWLGVDDGPRGPVAWVVEQRQQRGYGVEVELLTRGVR